ncbi:MAG TPA: glycosyltransferase family 4 protein [Kofleriaceae bacterium]|nr:glycosyltransferase family 4 protein [Kofleriaceae bacterium]
MDPLRIALISPLYESVPPSLYGGTERVVSWLAEELVELGHDVTLFASGQSRTRAHLVEVIDRPLRLHLDGRLLDPYAMHVAMAQQVRSRAGEFDVVHSHIDYLGFSAFRDSPTPMLTTLHGRLDIEGLDMIHGCHAMPVVSISDAQRAALPDARWIGTVYHGLPIDDYQFGCGSGDYLVFLGRFSREKRPEVAIEVARRAGVKLVIAAKVDEGDREFYDDVIAPMIRRARSCVEYIGEVDDREKVELLRNARALLFPVLWPEPFGLAMIEALACGTPVIARRCGSIPEVIDHGHTGFVCDDDDALVDCIHDLDLIDRGDCRRQAEERFSSARMAADYLSLYRALVEQARFDERRAHGRPSLTSPRSPRHLRGA